MSVVVGAAILTGGGGGAFGGDGGLVVFCQHATGRDAVGETVFGRQSELRG